MFVKAVKIFVRFIDSVLFTFAKSIIVSLTDNTNFPEPVPALGTVQTTITAFGAAITAAASRDRVQIAIKKQQRKLLLAQLRQLCDYVNTTANNNEEMIATSGFTPSKKPEPQHIYPPAAPKVSPGMNPGTINSQVPAVKTSKSYLHQYLPQNAPAGTEWTSFGSSRAKYTFTGLTSGAVYRIRVVALGSNEQIAYGPESVQLAAL